MNDLIVPVAHCRVCKQKVPVVVLGYTFNDEVEPELAGTTIQVVYCVICENMLSLLDDIQVEWYEPEELPKLTNYKLGEPNE